MDWNDDPDPTPAPGQSSRRPGTRLWLVASLPWLLVVGLLVFSGRGTADPDPDAAPPLEDAEVVVPEPSAMNGPQDASTDVVEPVPTEQGAHAPSVRMHDPALIADEDFSVPTPGLRVTEFQGRWRSMPGEEEAISLAVVAARAWLTGVEPALAVGGLQPSDPDGYAEHLVVEAVERPEAGALVVTLVAIVLDTGSEHTTTQVRRIAVPVAETAMGARIAGEPWELPRPALDQAPLEHTSMTDPLDLEAARTALRAAGLGSWELVALHDTASWPVIAEVAGRGEGSDVDTKEIWLRHHLGGFAVSGAPLTRPDLDPTAPVDEQDAS